MHKNVWRQCTLMILFVLVGYNIMGTALPAVAQAQVRPPVCPDASLSDERLCADALNAAQHYYIPRYRVAEEVVADQARYRIAFAPSGIGWTLTVYLVAYPAPAIEQTSLMATPLLPAVQVALHYHDATGSYALPFQEVTQEIEGRQIKAVLQLDTLAARDAVYLALTDPTQAAQLRIQRRVPVWVAPQVTHWGATTTDLNLTLDQVSLNGTGSILAVDPGQSLTAQVNYHLWNQIDCPRCIDQVVVGVEADAQACADMGIPGTAPGVSGPWAFTLVAPTTPGVYAVRARLVQHYGCPQAQQVYENDGVPATQPIGLLLVGQPVEDYTFDPLVVGAFMAQLDDSLTIPFVFPLESYAYIYRALAPAAASGGDFIQRTVAWEGRWYNYYQDAAERQRFYYLPDSFQLGQRSADGVPALSLSFIPDAGGAIEQIGGQLEYMAQPVVNDERIQAAAIALKQYAPTVDMMPLSTVQALQFRLALPRLSGSGYALREARISLRDGIVDRLNLSAQDFQAIWDAIFSQQGSDMTLFTGEVLVEIAGGYREQIAFNGRVQGDSQVLVNAITKPTIFPTYRREVEVRTIADVLVSGADPITAILVDVGAETVALTADQLSVSVSLPLPIRNVILGLVDWGEFPYAVQVIHQSGRSCYYDDKTAMAMIYLPDETKLHEAGGCD